MADLRGGSTVGGYPIFHAGNIGSWNQTAVAPTGVQRLNYEGYLYATKVFNAVYNDYAEYFLKDETMEPGDVVTINPNGEGYIKSTEAFDKLVVGVYSDDYAQCIGGKGDGHDEENYAAVGMAGRVRVKVTGKGEKGDLLVASDIPGVAMAIKADQYVPGTVIGKLLENFDSQEIVRVKMLVQNM